MESKEKNELTNSFRSLMKGLKLNQTLKPSNFKKGGNYEN